MSVKIIAQELKKKKKNFSTVNKFDCSLSLTKTEKWGSAHF